MVLCEQAIFIIFDENWISYIVLHIIADYNFISLFDLIIDGIYTKYSELSNKIESFHIQ